jgi:hypothetical protein
MSEWQDIASAPDDGEFLAGYFWRGVWKANVCKKRSRPTGLKLIEARSGWSFPASHWQPLPEPPLYYEMGGDK